MNRFAQIKNGTVIYIYETELKQCELSQVFASDCIWFDVTGTEVSVGCKVFYNREKECYEYVLPDEAVPMTKEEKIAYLTNSVQQYMDTKARERHYDDIKTAITYESSDDPIFKMEAIALRRWRDRVWRICYTILADVQAGKRQEVENSQSLIEELPVFEWPEME